VLAFSAIQRRLGGVGWAQVFSAFVTAIYYTVIVGYALYYLVGSFANPMPWNKSLSAKDCGSEANIVDPIEYYYANFLGYLDKNRECENYE